MYSKLTVGNKDVVPRRCKMLFYFGLSIVSFFAGTIFAATNTEWTAANAAYERGRFEEAKVLYLQMVKRGYSSPELFYNLGNSWFKLGDRGRAILNYERASVLDPEFKEALANLKTVHQMVGIEESPTLRTFLEFHSNYLLVVTVALFWLTLFGVAFWILGRGRLRRFGTILFSVVCILFLISGATTVWIGMGARDSQRALVVDANTSLMFGPANTARTVVGLLIGQEVRILSRRDDWTFCQTKEGSLGWVLSQKIEKIIP